MQYLFFCRFARCFKLHEMGDVDCTMKLSKVPKKINRIIQDVQKLRSPMF